MLKARVLAGVSSHSPDRVLAVGEQTA